MAKRGRKPKERKGYFYETEEEAIVKYINETNEEEKNHIFNTILYPALTKMIESIIRRYKLFVPDEEFEQNFSDTISYLLTKINHFRPTMPVYENYTGETNGIKFIDIWKHDLDSWDKDKWDEFPEYIHLLEYSGNYAESEIVDHGYFKKSIRHNKAYSYCGTVCKNYLMYKCTQYAKKRQRNTPYDDVFEEISNSERYSTNDENYSDIAARLVVNVSNEIENMIKNREEYSLTDEEVTVGTALISLLRNWEEILQTGGSNKLQKSSVLYYLREETMMTTKEVRDNMKKFKSAFLVLKKIELEDS